MRHAGLGLALLASAQLTLFSSPVFADDAKKAKQVDSDEAAPPPPPPPVASDSLHAKHKRGWIILGIGGVAAVTGIVLDIVGATQSGNIGGAGGAGDTQDTNNTRTNLYWGGTALIVAGVVTGIVGGSMVLAKTDETKATPTDHNEDASIDSVTKTAQAAFKSAPTFTLPIVGGTF